MLNRFSSLARAAAEFAHLAHSNPSQGFFQADQTLMVLFDTQPTEARAAALAELREWLCGRGFEFEAQAVFPVSGKQDGHTISLGFTTAVEVDETLPEIMNKWRDVVASR